MSTKKYKNQELKYDCSKSDSNDVKAASGGRATLALDLGKSVCVNQLGLSAKSFRARRVRISCRKLNVHVEDESLWFINRCACSVDTDRIHGGSR